MAGAIPIPAFFLHYTLVLSRVGKKWWVWISATYTITFVFFVANAMGLVVSGVVHRRQFAFWPVPGPLLLAQLIFFLLVVLCSLIVLLRNRKIVEGTQREQLRYTVAGTLLGFGGGMTNYFLWFGVPIDPWGNFGVFVGQSIMAYGFLRYRLIDLSLAIRNVLGYVLFVLTVALPVALLAIWKGDLTWSVVGILITGAVTPFLFGRLKEDVLKMVDRIPPFREKFGRFYKFSERTETVSAAVNIEDWAWRVVGAAKDLFEASGASLLIRYEDESAYIIKAGYGLTTAEMRLLSVPFDSPLISKLSTSHLALSRESLLENEVGQSFSRLDEEFRFLRAAVCVPIRYRGQLWAILNVDAKASGEMFNSMDLLHLTNLVGAAQHKLEILKGNDRRKWNDGALAHDLLRPFGLKGSFGKVELLLSNSNISNESKVVLREIKSDAHFVESGLRQLFDSGVDVKINVALISAREVVSRLCGKYKELFSSSSVELVENLAENPLLVHADPQLLEKRIFENLLENALRHTSCGGRVEVGGKSEGNEFFGWVKDTGVGIAPAIRATLFEPGVQGEENEGLAGLGLYSVKIVVEAHGGRVWVDSVPGKGATFFFTLPLAKDGE